MSKLSVYDKHFLSRKEKRMIKRLKKVYEKTTDPEIKEIAHMFAEIIRKMNGYSGGHDGAQFIPCE